MLTLKQQVLVLVLEFIRLSSYAGASYCRVRVTQPQFMEVYTTSNRVTIPCYFSANQCHSSTMDIRWFRFLAHTHEGLCTSSCTNTTKFKVLSTASENETLLEINHLSVEDSAIYFCGVASSRSNASTSKRTGAGTVLVIRDPKTYNQGVHIMAVILSLLILYLIALLAMFKFFSKPKFKTAERGDLNGKRSVSLQVKESKEAVCRAIAKEFYKKKRKRGPGHLNNHHKTDKPS